MGEEFFSSLKRGEIFYSGWRFHRLLRGIFRLGSPSRGRDLSYPESDHHGSLIDCPVKMETF